MNLSAQQKAFGLWLSAAGGQVRIVEQALVAARKEKAGQAPSYNDVLQKINELRAGRGQSSFGKNKEPEFA